MENKIDIVKNNLDFVDLGLSVTWANMNLEAENVTDSGAYLAFGEIEPKKTYSERTYKLSGYKDAAICENMGRTPTKEEWHELKTKCQWENGCIGKVEGVFVTGPNGGVIFLPKVGKMEKSKKILTQEVFAWSSNGLVFNYNGHSGHIMSESSYNGCVIRPVR